MKKFLKAILKVVTNKWCWLIIFVIGGVIFYSEYQKSEELRKCLDYSSASISNELMVLTRRMAPAGAERGARNGGGAHVYRAA